MDRRVDISWAEIAMAVGVFAIFTVGTVAVGNPLPVLIGMCGVAGLILLGSDPKKLLYGLIAYSMVVKFLVGDLGLPSVANYVCDGLLLLTMLFALWRPREGYVPSRGLRRVAMVLLVFWVIATVSALLNAVSPVLYIWACRNTFRLFGILFCCVRLLDHDDVFGLVKYFTVFFWINLVVCAYQYFVLGTGQDNTNGLFGTGSGGNAMMVILMFAVSALCLFGYSSRRKSMAELIATLAACCLLAAIAELKVYYILLALLIGLSVILNKPSFRNAAIVVLALMALFAGVRLLEAYNPGFAGFFSLENIVESSSAGGYSNEGELNRLTAVETLDSMFMSKPTERAFGLGFGAGQFTQFFESPLYVIWGEVLHWTWFTDAAIFLETGYVGLAIYVAIFAIIAVQSVRTRGRTGFDGWLVSACASIAVLCLVLIVYNCSLTVDPSCYFIGVMLAFPYILGMKGVPDEQRA